MPQFGGEIKMKKEKTYEKQNRECREPGGLHNLNCAKPPIKLQSTTFRRKK